MPATFQAGFTVVRMIVEVVIKSVGLNQVNFGAYGVFVNVAFSVVDAILDLLDYYLHTNWENVTNSVNDSAQTYRRSYDIRTARRVRGEQRQLDFIATSNSGSSGVVQWTVNSRLLLKGS